MSRPIVMTKTEKRTNQEQPKILNSSETPSNNKLTNTALNQLNKVEKAPVATKKADLAPKAKERSATFTVSTANTVKPTTNNQTLVKQAIVTSHNDNVKKSATMTNNSTTLIKSSLSKPPLPARVPAPNKSVINNNNNVINSHNLDVAKQSVAIKKTTTKVLESLPEQNVGSSNNSNANDAPITVSVKPTAPTKTFEESFKQYEEEVLKNYSSKEQNEIRQSLQLQKNDMNDELKKSAEKIVVLMNDKVKRHFKLQEQEEKLKTESNIIYYKQRTLLEYHILKGNVQELQECIEAFNFDCNSMNEKGLTLLSFALAESTFSQNLLKKEYEKKTSKAEQLEYQEKLNVLLKLIVAISDVLEGKTPSTKVANKKLGKLDSNIKKCSEHLKNAHAEIEKFNAAKNRKLLSFHQRMEQREKLLLERLQGKNREKAHQSFQHQVQELTQRLEVNIEKQRKIIEELTNKEASLKIQKEQLKQEQQIINYKQMEILQYHVIHDDLTLENFVNYLHLFGFDPNTRNENGQTLLMVALDKDLEKINEELVSYLLTTINGCISDNNNVDANKMFRLKSPLIKNPKATTGPMIDKYNRIYTLIRENQDKMLHLASNTHDDISKQIGILINALRDAILSAKKLDKDLERNLVRQVKSEIEMIMDGLSNQIAEEKKEQIINYIETEEKRILNKLDEIFTDYKKKTITKDELDKLLPAKVQEMRAKCKPGAFKADDTVNMETVKPAEPVVKRKGSFGALFSKSPTEALKKLVGKEDSTPPAPTN